MMFRPTDAQQAELGKLLQEQQDPSSPNYHHWVSPDEFADRFGLSQNDITKVVAWLESQGLTVKATGRNRRSVSFSGSAEQIETAFQTSTHKYTMNGAAYYANATDPAVPAALEDVVLGFRSLNNFKLKPRVRLRSRFTSNVTGNHYVTPGDFATIYDLAAPYASGLNGSGQKIAIAGQTDILVSDIRRFRALSGLPSNDPTVVLVPGSDDPGLNVDDLGEADLDIEWAGAVAPLQIIYVARRMSSTPSICDRPESRTDPEHQHGDCEQSSVSGYKFPRCSRSASQCSRHDDSRSCG